MTNGNDFVTGQIRGTDSYITTDGEVEFPKSVENAPLSKRELFAAMAMQGMLTNELMDGIAEAKLVAKDAVEQADALIAALNEETK